NMRQFSSREKEIIGKIKEKIHEVNPEAEIWLYGSRARGDVHAESDWDILILLNEEKVSRMDEMPYRDSIFDLQLEYEESISIFALSKKEWDEKHRITPFYENVKSEGVLI
ncbi:MAG: nucleotidyltransferase domain-containing protein, partial [Bacteroidales bacterium]|nr:nucleotidyltransferase domain-containing protein [Bacteroidales bacterium]